MVTVDTPYFAGDVTCCVIEEPVTDLILGNLPGMASAIPGLGGSIVPACVSTRAQIKQQVNTPKPLHNLHAISHDITPEKLSKLQKADKSLTKCFQAVNDSLNHIKHSFFFKDSVLYRSFVTDAETVHQIVVLQSLRSQVLQTAHDVLMSGHFGIRRTLTRIRSQFFWPMMSKDVTQYCRSCDICRKSFSKCRISKAPLQFMPMIQESLPHVPSQECKQTSHLSLDFKTQEQSSLEMGSVSAGIPLPGIPCLGH